LSASKTSFSDSMTYERDIRIKMSIKTWGTKSLLWKK
jgi:hypothetical protein